MSISCQLFFLFFLNSCLCKIPFLRVAFLCNSTFLLHKSTFSLLSPCTSTQVFNHYAYFFFFFSFILCYTKIQSHMNYLYLGMIPLNHYRLFIGQLRSYDTERLSSKFLFEKHVLTSVACNGTNIFIAYCSKNKVPAFHRVFQMKKFLMCRLSYDCITEFRNRLTDYL